MAPYKATRNKSRMHSFLCFADIATTGLLLHRADWKLKLTDTTYTHHCMQLHHLYCMLLKLSYTDSAPTSDRGSPSLWLDLL